MPVADPASRDQDIALWRGGRFDERVRRAWNQVTDRDIRAAGTLEALAATVAAKGGGEEAHVLALLQAFRAAESNPSVTDTLVRPGAPASA